MRKRNLWKKSASVLIAAAMIMTSVPVYAAGLDEPVEDVVVQETTEEAEDEAVGIELENEAEDETVMEEKTGEESVAEGENVAQIEDKTYSTLAEAIAAVPDGTDTTTTITLLANAEGGVKIGETAAKNILLDLNGFTYDVKECVGSTGTETNGMQLLKGSIVTIKNGTMTSTSTVSLGFMIKNYCNLTLENVVVNGPVNNCGQLVVNGEKTQIDAGNDWAITTGNYCQGDVITTEINAGRISSVACETPLWETGEATQNESVTTTINGGTIGKVGAYDWRAEFGDQYKNAPLLTNWHFIISDEAQIGTNEFSIKAGNEYFESLNRAVTEGNADVVLQKDVKVEETVNISNKNVTLDLNGHKIDASTSSGSSFNMGNANLTIKDTKKNGKILSEECLAVGENSSFILESGIIEVTKDYGIYVSNGGRAVVKDGQINSLYAPLTGNNTTGDMNFTVEGGTLTAAQGPAIYMPGQVALNISGGTLNGGISLRMGQVNISGGTINAIKDGIDNPKDYYYYSGNAWFPDALYVNGGTYTSDNESYSNSLKLNITGGTFNCLNTDGSAVALYVNGKVAQSMNMTISGGEFVSTKDAIAVHDMKTYVGEEYKDDYQVVENTATVSIAGGTFSEEPSEDYLAPEHYVHKGNVSGKWVVSTTDGHNYNYKNNGDYYFCICGDSVYIPPYTPPQPTTPPATTDTVTNPDGSTTSTTTQENTDGSTTTTVVDKDSNGNVTGTTETTEKTTGNTTTKTETATTVDGAQTVTETTTVKNQDGSTEETKKVTDKDANGNVTGTTETVEKTEGNTTTTKETTTAADGSQTVTESTLVKNEDGSSEEKATITAADGSVTNVTTTTQTDGSATEVKETSEKNDAGNTVDVTETKKINTEGTVTSVKEQSVIGNVADNTSATVNVLKDGEDNVKYSRATVNKTVDEDTTRVKLEGPVVDQIESASGTSNVTVTLNVKTEDGDTKYSLKVATKNLEAGNKLYVYKENPETGERTMVNSLLYTVTEDGSVTFNTKQNANFVLVNKTTAAALNKAIKKTLTAAKPSSSVKAGKKIKMALNPNLNMENVKSVKYSTTQSSVAKVSSNGTITAKKAGIVSIKAMITLKNGYIKTVTTKITVKE